MKRKLGIFERTTFLFGEYFSWHIVNVLRLDRLPTAQTLRTALNHLQQNHPLLGVRLERGADCLWFTAAGVPPIPLRQVDRADDDRWQTAVEEELHQHFNPFEGPLTRCTVLTGGSGPGELLFAIHHSIIDGTSLEQLMQELLDACTVLEAGAMLQPAAPTPTLPPMEQRFPAPYQGWALRLKLVGYLLRQAGGEMAYLLRTRQQRVPPISPDTQGRILTLKIPSATTATLIQKNRQERVTLNSALNAAILLAAHKHLYASQPARLHYLTFANLRPYLLPPTPPAVTSSDIAMLRFTAQLENNQDFWALARQINNQLHHATRRGEKFLSVIMGESLLKMIFRLQKFRFGVTALSLNSASKLRLEYPHFRVTGIHGFITNLGLGPEYTAQVNLFQDELWWDIVYLESDMPAELAQTIRQEILNILVQASAG